MDRQTVGERPVAVGMSGRGLLLALGVVLAGLGCNRSSPEGGGQSDQKVADAPRVGEAKQALTPTCITIRRGTAGAVADAQIANTLPPKNFGDIAVGNSGQVGGTARQLLLQFDLGAIPGGATITNAHVTLSETSTGAATVNVHRVLAPWTESTVTWQSLGGAFSPTTTVSFSNAAAYPIFDLTALVQSWVSGSAPNNGVLLEQAGTASTAYKTSETANVNDRPSLSVCYTPLACPAGLGNCDGNAANGCEASLNTNVNCGACGVACARPHATTSCSTGSCAFVGCAAGFGNCNGDLGDGCEASLTTSANCGGCGVACALPNATSSCATGTCAVVTCAAGFGDCDGNAANGCEASLATATDCGACGVACALPNAASSCAGGTCALGACAPGFANCNGNAADGCETSLATATDCGACGVACALANATSTCAGGACALVACAPGFHDCDGNPANGCEPAPCGNGGHCGAGSDCASAVCTGGLCAAPSCGDGVKNGGETGVDCGGACAACPPPCTPEVCDGVDSDCDGVIDNGNPGGGVACNSGPCGAGITLCSNGALICVPAQPTQGCTPPPVVTISAPADGAVIAAATVQVTGTVSAPATVIVADVPATVTGLSFSATVTLHEGTNVLTAAATDAAGSTGVASVTVLHDTTPPRIALLSPADNALINGATTTVVGIVQDLLLGVVDAGDVTVTVNGVAAQVAAGGFRAINVPVARGAGTITAVATDRGGNTASTVISVTGDPDPKAQILVASGDGQTAVVGTTLAQQLTARVVNNAGAPVAGVSVTFSMTRGNGAFPGGARVLTVPSDASGAASVALKLGTRAGAATDLAQATAAGFLGVATFAANASASPTGPRRVQAIDGTNQRVATASLAPLPLTVLLADSFGNPVSNQGVVFSVVQGGGRVNGATTATVSTDSDGRAFALLTAGGVAGINSQLVTATYPGANTVHFVASTLVAGPPAATAVSGVIQTNENAPIANVLITIRGTALQALTDAEGRFSITGAPVGHVHLVVDGTTAGPYPPLSFERDLLSGVDNSMDRPVYLPLIDADGVGIANPTSDVELRRADTPGLVFTIPAGSATFKGSLPKVGTVQVIRVHNDKIPMVPPEGTAPSIALAIMPADAQFDPPAPIRFPNVEGRAPGEIVTIYSYDHDLGAFVGVGTAQVSEDGLEVASGPGQGIVKGGWHLIPPTPAFPPTQFNAICQSVSCDCSGFCTGYSYWDYSDPNNDPTLTCNTNPDTTIAGSNLAGLPTPTPDFDCYGCPDDFSTPACATLILTGIPCTRNDPTTATCNVAGTCVIPTFSNPTGLPVCCPTGQFCPNPAICPTSPGQSVCCQTACDLQGCCP
jgi:hypothetical protein